MFTRSLGMLAFVAVLGTTAYATDFTEIEGNETKAFASGAGPLVVGDRLIGNTTGSSTAAGAASLDTWRFSTAVTALGIYRHRLTITTTGTAGHIGSLRGTGQVGAVAGPWPGPVGTANTTDSAAQSSSSTTTPSRFNQWYGFGKGESMYYRITGTTSTTANYAVEYSMEQVTAMNLGAFNEGLISFSTVGTSTTDTDMWVYDGNFNAIAGYGNDDEGVNNGGTGTTGQSNLNRTYSQGVYYIALTNFNLANNMGSACDDDFRTGTMMDFADSVVNSSSATNVNLNFKMTDSYGTQNFSATKIGAYDVVFAKFVVVPEPATMAVLGLGVVPFLRKRRK